MRIFSGPGPQRVRGRTVAKDNRRCKFGGTRNPLIKRLTKITTEEHRRCFRAHGLWRRDEIIDNPMDNVSIRQCGFKIYEKKEKKTRPKTEMLIYK